jgi:predicted ribosome quality control (RQC) complex YloA/Tae2 family protein
MQQNNFYLLKKLAQELSQSLQGMELATCFTQDKDEIILGFCLTEKQGKEFYIKASLNAQLSCLCFMEDFQRAKKNTVELFTDTISKRVLNVKITENDRSFCIDLEDGFSFLFKMYGSRANLILLENGEVNEVFNKKLQSDFSINVAQLAKKVVFTFEEFEKNNFEIKNFLHTFDKYCLQYLSNQGFDVALPTEKWIILKETIEKLENPKFLVAQDANHLPVLSMLPFREFSDVKVYISAILALNHFFLNSLKINGLDSEKAQAIRLLEKRISQTQQYLKKTAEKLTDLEKNSNHEQIGHLIMANLHQIPAKATEISLLDFYTEKPVSIKLKMELSAQKNAENYYRKSKNQKIEIEKIYENLESKELHLENLKKTILKLQEINNFKELRKYIKENSKIIDEKPENIFPFKQYEYENFVIWVGRNAQNNDLLTQKYAYKEDLWLHAKDVSGSHVVVKYQAGKVFPKTVVEKAAQLAAFYSKRKNDSLCPVIVTPKKHVRKTKDLAFGQVIVEREQVIMVVPSDF